MDYHVPVMLKESIEGLNIKTNGVYVDVTFGGGGHSEAILNELTEGHLYAFDQDEEADSNAMKYKERSFTFIRANFRYLKKYLRIYGVDRVDGILGDLGISSHQIDEASRGFSTRMDGPLDMRMDSHAAISAQNVIADSEENELKQMFQDLGEVRNANAVVRAICRARVQNPIETTGQLIEVIAPLAPRGRHNKFYAQVFQALRMKVNNELGALQALLLEGTELLNKGGRFVLLSYHSLEDRMVKNFFNKGNVSGEMEKDF